MKDRPPFPLLRLPANGFMTCTLKMDQRHHLGKMAHMQGICRWVKTNITRNNSLLKFIFGSRHDIMQHAPPTELFNKILVSGHKVDKDNISLPLSGNKTRF